MKWDNDSLVTAYALEEAPTSERENVELLLQDSEENQQWVEDVQWMAQLLETELQRGPLPSLTSEQSQQVKEALVVGLPLQEVHETQTDAQETNASPSVELAEPDASTTIEEPQPQKHGFFSGGWLETVSALCILTVYGFVVLSYTGYHFYESPAKSRAVNKYRPRPVKKRVSPMLPLKRVSPSGKNTVLGQKNRKPVSSLKGKPSWKKPWSTVNYQDSPARSNLDLVKREEGRQGQDKWRRHAAQIRDGEANHGVRALGESYGTLVENPFRRAWRHPLSTFSIDVDTASYANVRRFLQHHTRPPKDSVRIEEMVNYFSYNYAPPKGNDPFSAHVEIAAAPWNPSSRLVRIGLKAKELQRKRRPATNLVFLLDVSCSMTPANKLPLLKRSFRLMLNQLTERDRVAIVVYAGASGLVLPSTSGEHRSTIVNALNRLQSGGSTNGGAGIQLAYQVAVQNYIRGGVNRVILATDGDFNVGVTNHNDLTKLIQRKAKSGVYFSALGFGTGNYNDKLMETLSNKGNGNYAYIDSFAEAKKVLGQQLFGTLVTVAKDVKIQVEFNPHKVESYRLVGYANRMLKAKDFDNDKKDAGDIGAGHTVTALYEVKLATKKTSARRLRYQVKQANPALAKELLNLKLRYKQPDGSTSKLLKFPIQDKGKPFSQSSKDFQFASAVAAFGMLLRNSPYRGKATFDSILEIAQSSKGGDEKGYRAEFVRLVKRAKSLYQRRR